jgi:hypothetical protein
MRNLDLNAMCVQEMDKNAMMTVDGGIAPIVWLILGVIVSECLDRDAPSDFMEGYNDARK